MNAVFFAAAWDDFFKILPFIIVVLVWVINQFAGKLQPPQPPVKRLPPIQPPAPGQPAVPRGQQPLQAEIEEFLRQAQALREGRPVPQRNQAAADRRRAAAEQLEPGGAKRRQRPPRRAPQGGTNPTLQRPSTANVPPAQAETTDAPRESVAQYVAEHIDSSKFAQRTARSAIFRKKPTTFRSTCSACSNTASAN